MTVEPFGDYGSSLRGSPAGDRSNPEARDCFASLAMTVLLGLLLFSPIVSAETKSPLTVFQKANGAYRGGDYAEAASLYESLIVKGEGNASVYYNLGNAYFKQDQLGRAILYYEKARRLAPRDRDISANLSHARGLLEYRIEDKRNWYVRTGEAVLAHFTLIELGITSLGFGLLFLVSWAFSLYFLPPSPWGSRRKGLLVITLIFFSLWLFKGAPSLTPQEAIVLKPQAVVRYGPSFKDQVALRLGEGLKVWVKKQTGEWSRIVLTNSETGWIYQEEIGVI